MNSGLVLSVTTGQSLQREPGLHRGCFLFHLRQLQAPTLRVYLGLPHCLQHFHPCKLLHSSGETPNTHLAKRARDLAVHEVKQIKNLKGLEKSSLLAVLGLSSCKQRTGCRAALEYSSHPNSCSLQLPDTCSLLDQVELPGRLSCSFSHFDTLRVL